MLKGTANLKPYDYSSSCTFYLGAVLVVLICQALAAFIAAAVSGNDPNISSNADFNTAFMIVVQIVNAAFILGYTKIKKRSFDFTLVRRDGDNKGVTPAVIIVPVVAAVLLMVGMYLPTVWYGYLTRAIGLPEDYGALELNTASSVVMIVIASVFLAPIFEEFIYRGVLLHGLTHEKKPVAAVLLSALAFMLMHMNPVQVVFQFALGVLSGFIALKSKRLLPSVILHASANALALIVEMTPLGSAIASAVAWLTENPAAAVFITLGLFAAAGAALYALVRFGFDIKGTIESFKSGRSKINDDPAAAKPEADENAEGSAMPAENESDVLSAVEISKDLVRRDGTFKYYIALGICAVMFVINLVTGIIA